jgi:hypothetical protein
LTQPNAGLDTSNIHISSALNQEVPVAPNGDSLEEDFLSKVDLIPPPREIVSLLKKAERKEVTSALYVRCLQAYQELTQLSDMSEEHSR